MLVRVLFVSHAVELGGAELMLLRLLGQAPQSVRASLAVPHEGPLSVRARALHVPVRIVGPGAGVLGYRRGQPTRSPAAFLRALSELPPAIAAVALEARRHDLVVTNSTKAHLYGALAARVAGVRCAWRLHDIIDHNGFAPAVQQLYRQASRWLPDRVVAVSEAAALPIRSAGAKEVLVAANGVEVPLAARPDEGASVRRELGIAPDAKVVLLLGRLTRMKGAEVLFEALESLPQAVALVAGDATYSEEEDYRAALERAAAPLGGRVVFAGFRADLGPLFRAADVLAHPSVKPDALPTVVLEALAAGVPVVASGSGGAPEILRDEEGGLVVPAGDARCLAAALSRVLSDAVLRERLVARGRRRALDFENRSATIRVWRALLETLPAVG